MEAFVIVAILAIVAAATFRGIREMRAQEAAQKQLLVQSGFSPCDAEQGRLEEIVRSLRDSAAFRVRNPWKRTSARGTVYWYEVSSEAAGDNQRVAADEFLCSVVRPSPQPFLLYLKPTPLKGLGSRLIEKLVTVFAPPRLHALDLPPDAHSEALLAAFGPRSAAIQDLVDAEKLALFAQGARHGVFAVRGQGDHCALELFGAQARKALQSTGWLDTWAFVQQLAG